MSKFHVRTICRIGVMAALYVLLNMVSIKAGNLRITFASLPVVTAALLFGPLEAVLVALVGEFLNQLLGGYGITATTALWLVPPALRGLAVGFGADVFSRRGTQTLESCPAACYGVCVAAALLTTVSNTLVIAVDGLVYGYYTPALVLGDFAWRLVSGMVIAVVIATVAMPLTGLLRRQGLGRA
ncbi:folate family ECF transporter S component [Oscillibacter sp.]|uniref:folate family ECF transporter S component n=1 Tax=Oscillibacter sp. TaxID=1945593 RepID=UPI0026033A81|nr:folate family ECF transporter S component [Oscillibacter sp.]MDD3346359.1 folate family ECF transporter S component [Oscillibacter sp.]